MNYQKKAERLLVKYKKLLNLQDWDITVSVLDEFTAADKSDALAYCSIVQGRKTVAIFLLSPDVIIERQAQVKAVIDALDLEDRDLEKTLLHELCHVLLCKFLRWEPRGKKDKEQFEMDMESHIDDLMKILYTLSHHAK